MTINYDAPAVLQEWDDELTRAGAIYKGTLAGCISQFLLKPQNRRYEIMVGKEAGTGKTVLYETDIRTLARRADFKKDF
jgi:hypothetical protein